MDRASDLQADYDRLGELLAVETGSAAAAIARERRILGAELDRLVTPGEVPLIDELADRRRASSEDPRPPARRRKSG